MSQPAYEQMEATIQKLTQDLSTIDDELHALEGEEMNQMSPWAYVALQRKVDHLMQKKRTLQDAWDRAMNELAAYRASLPSPQDPHLRVEGDPA